MNTTTPNTTTLALDNSPHRIEPTDLRALLEETLFVSREGERFDHTVRVARSGAMALHGGRALRALLDVYGFGAAAFALLLVAFESTNDRANFVATTNPLVVALGLSVESFAKLLIVCDSSPDLLNAVRALRGASFALDDATTALVVSAAHVVDPESLALDPGEAAMRVEIEGREAVRELVELHVRAGYTSDDATRAALESVERGVETARAFCVQATQTEAA